MEHIKQQQPEQQQVKWYYRDPQDLIQGMIFHSVVLYHHNFINIRINIFKVLL